MAFIEECPCIFMRGSTCLFDLLYKAVTYSFVQKLALCWIWWVVASHPCTASPGACVSLVVLYKHL